MAELDDDTDEIVATTRTQLSVDLRLEHGGQHPMADRAPIEQEFRRRLEAVKTTDPKYTFDRDGRPGAIAAVRSALPLIERDLFDAVMEDCECELAAVRETLFQMLEER
jgi:hypothetical protein